MEPRHRHHPRCFATLFYNDTHPSGQSRRTFVHDEALVRQWVALMLRHTELPIFIMHNVDNDAARVLAPFLSSSQLHLRQVDLIVVEPPGTLPWYRLTHTKLHAWNLPCETAALLDYDGIPLTTPDPIFDECDAALVREPSSPPLCGVGDVVTPFRQAKRHDYLNAGVLVVRPSRSVHSWLLREAARDAQLQRARYYAEQGFFHERAMRWSRLPTGFNLQGMRYGGYWQPQVVRTAGGRLNATATDFYLHRKFFEPGMRILLLRLGLFECDSPNRTLADAYGRCYTSLSKVAG